MGGVISGLFGGGGGGDSTTTVSYPPEVKQGVAETLDLARNLGARPYVPYTQPRVAGLAQGEKDAISTAQQYSGAYRPTFDTARDLTKSSAGAYGGSYTPTAVTAPDVNTSAFSSEAAQRYMNPYIDVALEPQLRRLEEFTIRQQQQDRANAASIGAFGGGRQGFLEAQREEDLLEAQGDVLGRGYASAYDRAVGAFQTDEQRRLQGDLANQGLARDLGIYNESQKMGATALDADIYGANRERERTAGQGLGLLEGQESALTDADLSRLMTTGGLERSVTQQSLNTMYSDFLEQRDWDDRALDYMIRALSGVPLEQTQTTNADDPNVLAQLAGAGASLYGMGAFG